MNTRSMSTASFLFLILAAGCRRSENPVSPTEPLGFDASIPWTQTTASVGRDPRLAVIDTILFAGGYYGGVSRSDDYGANWIEVNTGLSTNLIYAVGASGLTLFAGTNGAGVFRSTDYGASWTTTGMKNTDANAFAVIGTRIFVAGNSEPWRGVSISTDNGATWDARNSGFPSAYFYCLAVSATSLFVGTNTGIFRSTDDGGNWTAVNNGLGNMDINVVAAIGLNLFAGTQGSGVFLSTDNGANWISTGLKKTYVYSLAAIGTNILAGTYEGVFLSTNNGTSWIAAGQGQLASPNEVTSFALIGRNVFASNYGGQVWRHPF